MRNLVILAFAALVARSAAAADGPARRFAVVAGTNLAAPARTPLRYATTDARDVARVLRRLGGVALDDLVLLEDPDAETLRGALARVGVEAAHAREAGRRVELFLYYSGHSDDQALLLGSSRMPYVELRKELERVPADVRVAILDSCASGAITRAKGGVHKPPFLLDESSRVSGYAFLTSSAADEVAQESDRLRGSFFTHALLTGLRGAADTSGDGVVTLNEAYQYAFRETLAVTEATQGGPQHANYDIGLVGSGDVIMTDLRKADAVLVVPETLDGRVYVRTADGRLVAELRKLRGARIDLALDEGRYSVIVTQDRRVLSGSVELTSSGRAVLEESRLTPAALEPATARGPEPIAEESGREDVGLGWVSIRGGGLVALGMQNLSGGEISVSAGLWLVGRILGGELVTGFSRVSGDATGFLPGNGVDQGGYTVFYSYDARVRNQVTTVPILVALRLAYPTGRVRPYATAGAGLYLSRYERWPAQNYPWLAPGADHLQEDKAGVGLNAGAGLTIGLSRSVGLSLAGRYDFARHTSALQEGVTTEALQVEAGIQVDF
jgi:opacity protein-like surface antigen